MCFTPICGMTGAAKPMSDRLNGVARIEADLRDMLPAPAFRDGVGYLTEPRGRWAGAPLCT